MGAFDWTVIWKSMPFLWEGLLLSFELTGLAIIGGILLGTLLALGRLSPIKPLAWVIGLYVNFLRSLPLILVIFWFYILAPKALGRPIPAFQAVLIAFVAFEAAYYCEIIRAGIGSVRRGQINAAMALGLTKWQSMRYVVLPQAFRNMVPVLLTQSIVMFQDTSLVYVVGLRAFLTTADTVANSTNRPIELYTTVGITFLVICFAASRLVNLLRRRYAL